MVHLNMLSRRNWHVHNFHIFQQKMYDFLTILSQNYAKPKTLDQLIELTDANISVNDSRRLKLNLNINMLTYLQFKL